MRGFIKQYAEGAFEPAVISVLEDAFEDAWRRVETSKAPYGTEEYAAAGRTIIAKYIINEPKAGERDPRWLAPEDIVTRLFSLLIALPGDLLDAVERVVL